MIRTGGTLSWPAHPSLDIHEINPQSWGSVQDWEGDEVVGRLTVQRSGADSVYVNDLSVRPEYRRQGRATRMLVVTAFWARHMGADQVYLATGRSEQYAPARALYQKLGFAQTDRRDPYCLYLKAGVEDIMRTLHDEEDK